MQTLKLITAHVTFIFNRNFQNVYFKQMALCIQYNIKLLTIIWNYIWFKSRLRHILCNKSYEKCNKAYCTKSIFEGDRNKCERPQYHFQWYIDHALNDRGLLYFINHVIELVQSTPYYLPLNNIRILSIIIKKTEKTYDV